MDPATTVPVPTEKKPRGRKTTTKKMVPTAKKRLKVKDAVVVEAPKPLVEYLYKKKKVGKNEYVIERKIGVLYANVDEAGKICIGFSVCHGSKDRFDYIRNLIHKPGHGLNMAIVRAKRWSGRQFYEPLPDILDVPEETVVRIPVTAHLPLFHFISRCKRYYKERDLPSWANDFAVDYENYLATKD